MKSNERINKILEELGYGVIRKNKLGEVVYINKYLQDVNLEECDLKKSDVESGLFYTPFPNVALLDELQVGVYTKLDGDVKYVNRYLLEKTTASDFRKIEDYITETTFQEKVYDLVQGTYYMERSKFLDFNILHDKTEVVNLETHIDTIKKLLDVQHIQKEKFVSNITHDLKTPLSSIISLLTLLSTTTSLNQQQRYMRMIQECSFNLLEIVNDILDYTKLEIGNILLEDVPLNIRDTFTDLTLIINEMIGKKSVKFNSFVSIDVPEIILVDIKRLKQIILNVVSHSLLYTETGLLQISVNNISKETYMGFMDSLVKCKVCFRYACHLCQNKLKCVCDVQKCICCNKGPIDENTSVYLQFDIIDTGQKIEEEKKDILFSDQYNSNYSGLLGMYIVNKLVYLMDGHIVLDKQRKNGNMYTFVMRLSKSSKMNIKDLVENNFIVILVYNNTLRMEILNFLTRYSKNLISVSSIEEAEFYTKKHTIDYIIGDTRESDITSFMSGVLGVNLIGYKKIKGVDGGNIKLLESVSEDSFINVLKK